MNYTENRMRWHEVLHPDPRKDKAYTSILMLSITVFVAASILYLVGVQHAWTPTCALLSFTIALLDLFIAACTCKGNKGIEALLVSTIWFCAAICALLLVACGLYLNINYIPGCIAAFTCLIFFLVQLGCFWVATHKFKKSAQTDSQACMRFKECKFYAMLLIVATVLVVYAIVFTSEEIVRPILSVFAGSFLSLMIFSQIRTLYMIEVPTVMQPSSSKIAKMNQLHRSRRRRMAKRK